MFTELTAVHAGFLTQFQNHIFGKMFALVPPRPPCYPKIIKQRVGSNMDFSNTRKKQKHNIRFPMPDIPRDLWCDFRIDFVEHNLTLVQLAEKYHCDPRTVKSCISHNKSSYQLGQKSTPTRIQLYEKQIYDLLFHNKESIPPDVSTVYALSQLIYPLLKEHGYSGSERTLRNHLQKQPYVKALLEQQQSSTHPEPEKETL